MLNLREPLGLGECVERLGRIPEAKLAEPPGSCARFVDAAWAEGATQLEVLITSPGRQAANGDELLAAISAPPPARPARILSAEEEGRLAFVGALARRPAAREPARRGRRRRRRIGPGRRRARGATAPHWLARSISARAG